jgi:hypothetical protein
MFADRVQVSWDAAKSRWLVRIEVGSEVIRRYCNQPRNADEGSLRQAAEQTVIDEGYQFDAANISIGH